MFTSLRSESMMCTGQEFRLSVRWFWFSELRQLWLGSISRSIRWWRQRDCCWWVKCISTRRHSVPVSATKFHFDGWPQQTGVEADQCRPGRGRVRAHHVPHVVPWRAWRRINRSRLWQAAAAEQDGWLWRPLQETRHGSGGQHSAGADGRRRWDEGSWSSEGGSNVMDGSSVRLQPRNDDARTALHHSRRPLRCQEVSCFSVTWFFR